MVHEALATLCTNRDSLLRERTASAQAFRASFRGIVELVDTSATVSDLNLAHRRIRTARHAYEEARDALEDHRAEHGC